MALPREGPVVFSDAYVAYQFDQMNTIVAETLASKRATRGENRISTNDVYVSFNTASALRAITGKKTHHTIVFDGARVVLEYLGWRVVTYGAEKLSVVRRDTAGNVTMMMWKRNGAPSRSQADGPAVVQLVRGEQGAYWRYEYMVDGEYRREDGPALMYWGDTSHQIGRQRWSTLVAMRKNTHYQDTHCECLVLYGDGNASQSLDNAPRTPFHFYCIPRRLQDLPSYYHPVNHSQWPAAMRRRLRAVASAVTTSLALLLNLSEFQTPAARSIFDLK
jgi:hypothetical protein